jgi:phospholipid/cholesterol/gamma-HCH transport system ATP-binding protein
MTRGQDPPASGLDASHVVSIHKLWTVFRTPQAQFVIHKDLDLTIERGEVVSLVGGSGSGKTTLLRQILGLETPTQGTVNVLGAPAAELGARGAASRVGMLFQRGALFSAFSVLDNIAFPLRELGTLPEELIRDCALVKLQMVGLGAEHATKMPSDLSGGMIKRVASWIHPCSCSMSPRRGWIPKAQTVLWLCCAACTKSWA